jgi:hypothetical protein
MAMEAGLYRHRVRELVIAEGIPMSRLVTPRKEPNTPTIKMERMTENEAKVILSKERDTMFQKVKEARDAKKSLSNV